MTEKFTGVIPVTSFIEGTIALHFASYVEAPYHDRGGLMIVGPTGTLKTSILDVLDKNYENFFTVSNAYMDTMIKMQPAFYNRTIRSLCFPDLQSIYAGDPRTAARIEQMMMQLSGEATRTVGGNQDTRFAKFKSHCTIFGAMTPEFKMRHEHKWEESGFHRRFLWATYTLEDPDVLSRAIENWQLASLGTYNIPRIPGNGLIPDSLNKEERKEIATWVRYQPSPHEIQRQLLCKAVCALRWHYKQNHIKDNAIEIMHEFAESLQENAGLMKLPPQEFDIIERSKRNGNK